MTATATINIGGKVENAPTGGKTFQGLITSTNAVNVTQDVTLAEGDNTIDVPPGATAVVIQPPSGNTQPMTVTLVLSATNPSVISFDPSQVTLTLNVEADTASPTEFSFV